MCVDLAGALFNTILLPTDGDIARAVGNESTKYHEQATEAGAAHSSGMPHLHSLLKLVETLLSDRKLAPEAGAGRPRGTPGLHDRGDGGRARRRVVGGAVVPDLATHPRQTTSLQLRVEDPAACCSRSSGMAARSRRAGRRH